MMTRTQGSAPCDMLPPVRGSITRDAPLKDLVWFRAGGPAELLFRPADADDLASFLAAKPADLKVSVIGVGMRSHAGVARTMFSALAAKGINIQVISTSEIKVSVLIGAEYTELAVRALHTAYGLDAA